MLRQVRTQVSTAERRSVSIAQASNMPQQAAASAAAPSQPLSIPLSQGQGQSQTQSPVHGQGQPESQASVAMLSPLNQNMMLSLGGQSAPSAVLRWATMSGGPILASQMQILQTAALANRSLPQAMGDPLILRPSLETSLCWAAQ
ncbi:unnamed protein product [Ostreobium quekettii]|uniref:Uncharacterized protein n=1 Tax=Ostreobium quekettii TaxID=121088 RepID=A0A8S1J6D6_9CHLO|nr:unnamed protein product [Ostreobium quekettii]